MWRNGEAVYYALMLDNFRTLWGDFLLNHPLLMKVLSLITYYLVEGALPILLAFFGFWWRFRILIIVIMCGFHLSLSVFMHLGLFPWICIAGWLAFLPSEFWEYLHQRLPSYNKFSKVYYDEGCVFCKKACFLIKSFLILPHVSFLPVKSNDKALMEMEKSNSWLIYNEEVKWQSAWSAWAILVSHSPLFFYLAPLLKIKFISRIGDRIYRGVANNRNILGHFLPPFKSEEALGQSDLGLRRRGESRVEVQGQSDLEIQEAGHSSGRGTRPVVQGQSDLEIQESGRSSGRGTRWRGETRVEVQGQSDLEIQEAGRSSGRGTRPVWYTAKLGTMLLRTLRGGALFKLWYTACFVYVLMWNIRTLNFEYYEQYMPKKLNSIGYFFHLDQYWNMFASYPLSHTGWLVLSAVKKNTGEKIDLWRDGSFICKSCVDLEKKDKKENTEKKKKPIEKVEKIEAKKKTETEKEKYKQCLQSCDAYMMDRPNRYDEFFPVFRLRKLLENLVGKSKMYSSRYLKYKCREWNKKNKEDPIESIEMIFMRYKVPPYGDDLPPPEKITIRKKFC